MTIVFKGFLFSELFSIFAQFKTWKIWFTVDCITLKVWATGILQIRKSMQIRKPFALDPSLSCVPPTLANDFAAYTYCGAYFVAPERPHNVTRGWEV